MGENADAAVIAPADAAAIVSDDEFRSAMKDLGMSPDRHGGAPGYVVGGYRMTRPIPERIALATKFPLGAPITFDARRVRPAFDRWRLPPEVPQASLALISGKFANERLLEPTAPLREGAWMPRRQQLVRRNGRRIRKTW